MEIFVKRLGGQAADKAVVWAHGWGRHHGDFVPAAEALETRAQHLLLDLPGFGQTPEPSEPWGTADYADAIYEQVLKPLDKPVVWVGHSYGCRVGVQMAARHPEAIQALILSAAAGLKRHRKGAEQAKFLSRKYGFKALKSITPESQRNKLRGLFGSTDYKQSGSMRGVFLNAVNEDLSEQAKTVTAPTRLLFGEADTETPVELGERLQALIPNAQLLVIPGLGHLDILTRGRNQIIKSVAEFL